MSSVKEFKLEKVSWLFELQCELFYDFVAQFASSGFACIFNSIQKGLPTKK